MELPYVFDNLNYRRIITDIMYMYLLGEKVQIQIVNIIEKHDVLMQNCVFQLESQPKTGKTTTFGVIE